MKALIFERVEELTSFVGALEGAISSVRVSLYLLGEPKGGEPCALALTGYKKSGPLKELITPDLEGSLSPLKHKQVTLSSSSGASKKLNVLSFSEGLAFEALAPLRPWGSPPEGLGERPVLFVAHRPEDVTRLALDCFKLDNDQLELATLEGQEGERRYLIRALNPSYFLVQRYLGEQAELSLTPRPLGPEVQVFYELKPRLYVAWGFEPSAPQRWRSAEPPQAGLTMLTPELVAPPITLQELSWESVYERAQFKLSAQADEGWRPAEGHELSFELPLSLNRVARPRPAELWLLEADDLDSLERLLSVIDEEELHELLISVQEREGGGGRYFLKERPGAKGGRYLDLGGRAFSSYLGYHNLFVSCEVELQPKLRRDRYPELFELKSGALTVLDASGEADEEVTLYRFSEQSFEPLSALSAYHINAAQEQLTSVARQAVFDLSPYDGAPALTDVLQRLAPLLYQGKSPTGAQALTRGGGSSLRPSQGSDDELDLEWALGEELEDRLGDDLDDLPSSIEEDARQANRKERRVKGLARKRQKRRGVKLTDSEAAALKAELLNELLKARSEEELLELWGGLATLPQPNQTERQEALFELAWLNRDRLSEVDDAEPLSALLGSPLSAALYETLKGHEPPSSDLLEGALRSLDATESPQQEKRTAALIATIKISQLSVDERHEPLVRLVSSVEANESSWGKRARWLLWRQLSSLSGSERQLVRAREQVLGALNEKGVAVNDIPSVIVKHLSNKRMVQTADKSEEAQAELALVQSHLSTLSASILQGSEVSPTRTTLGRVLLTCAYHELSLKHERDTLFDGLIEALYELPHLPRAWGLSMLSGASELLNKRQKSQCDKRISESTLLMSPADRDELRALLLIKIQRDQRDRARALSDLTKRSTNYALSSQIVDLPELSVQLDALQEVTRAADYTETERRFESLVQELSKLFEQAALAQPLCFVTDQLDALCVKLKWFPNTPAFIASLQALSEVLRTLLSRELEVEQAALIRRADASLASAQIKLVGEGQAKMQLEALWADLERSTLPWEVTRPSFELALRVIHSLELHERSAAIERLTVALLSRLSEKRSFKASSLSLIAQLVEACLSKEELATTAYQEYCEREELTLRDAIFSAQH